MPTIGGAGRLICFFRCTCFLIDRKQRLIKLRPSNYVPAVCAHGPALWLCPSQTGKRYRSPRCLLNFNFVHIEWRCNIPARGVTRPVEKHVIFLYPCFFAAPVFDGLFDYYSRLDLACVVI